MSTGQILFTREGLESAKQKLAALRESRPGAVETLKHARELGDLSENGLYKGARARLSSIDSQIAWLDNLVARATVVEATTDGTVGIGKTVVIKQNGETRIVQIVGEYEVDPLRGKISHKSPLGMALLGRKSNEEITVSVPAGTTRYTIIKVK